MTHMKLGDNKVFKNRPQVELVKTGFLLIGQSAFELGGMVCRKGLKVCPWQKGAKISRELCPTNQTKTQ